MPTIEESFDNAIDLLKSARKKAKRNFPKAKELTSEAIAALGPILVTPVGPDIQDGPLSAAARRGVKRPG